MLFASGHHGLSPILHLVRLQASKLARLAKNAVSVAMTAAMTASRSWQHARIRRRSSSPRPRSRTAPIRAEATRQEASLAVSYTGLSVARPAYVFMGLPRRSTSSSPLIFSLASAEDDQLRERTAGLIDRLAQADLSDTCRTVRDRGQRRAALGRRNLRIRAPHAVSQRRPN